MALGCMKSSWDGLDALRSPLVTVLIMVILGRATCSMVSKGYTVSLSLEEDRITCECQFAELEVKCAPAERLLT